MQARSLTVVKQLLKASLLLVILCTVVRFAFASAAASQNYSITMTPSSSEVQAPPGGATSSSFTVVNEGTSGYNIALSVSPYHVVGDNYDPQFRVLPGKTDASKWLHLTTASTQYLPARQPQTIGYTLIVPNGTAPGGYYAVIFAETEPAKPEAGVIAHNRVGDILYITVTGPVKEGGSLKSTAVPHIFFGSHLPLSLIVSNTGGLHFLTTAKLSVMNLSNKNVFQANLQRYVLPQTERLMTTSWDRVPLFGIYKVRGSATVAGHLQQLPPQRVLVIRPWLFIVMIVLAVGLLSLPVNYVRAHRKKSRPDRSFKSHVRR